MKLYNLYAELISNPFAPKKYRDLAKHYEQIGDKNNAEAFLHALITKFKTNESDDTHFDTQQRIDDL